MIARVRGTEDLLDLTLYNFIVGKTQEHFGRHNFNQISTPILENTQLFVHSLGTGTDVVSKEMYIIDGDQDNSICLRPEVTAATIRACFENRIDRFPWKVFNIGPMFRRERPQKGRLRQFHQISIEVIGTSAIGQDAQFIKMLDTLFSNVFKLENYALKINFLGCASDRATHKEKLIVFLNSLIDQICPTCIERKDKNTLRVFDCKNETCKNLYTKAPRLTDCLCSTCDQEWQTLQTLLQFTSVNYIIDTNLVRGLDYYNRTVFEFFSKDLGAQDTFCGGGRYSLGREVGAKEDYESIGAAMGIERLLLLLEPLQHQLALTQPPVLHVILPLANEQDALALLLANTLQQNKLATDIIFEKASMTNMLKKANRTGAKYVLVLGEQEQQDGTVTIKNMMTGQTETVKQAEAVNFLK
ncbi:histidine--tRNA ligase [Candidatus Babeliales bacterium]|nr:histidine--tRNA ligase [Candidatus Babeliales bacterium]MBY0353681.1 histidine--tRNA ligase [Candidatus Babeliales bacterium]